MAPAEPSEWSPEKSIANDLIESRPTSIGAVWGKRTATRTSGKIMSPSVLVVQLAWSIFRSCLSFCPTDSSLIREVRRRGRATTILPAHLA